MVVAVYHYLFFFNDTATTEIYTLSLHDALPICKVLRQRAAHVVVVKVVDDHRPFDPCAVRDVIGSEEDRKSTRLNSSHSQISYAVFCLKKKKYQDYRQRKPIRTTRP